MKKIVFLIFLAVWGFCLTSVASEQRGSKRPLPEEFEHPRPLKKSKLDDLNPRIPQLKSKVIDLLIEQLVDSIVDLVHQQKQAAFFSVPALFSAFLDQNKIVLESVPHDLLSTIFFQVIVRLVLVKELLTVQETNQLLALVLEPQRFIKELDPFCPITINQLPVFSNKQKQILAAIKKLFVENMIATHAYQTIGINTVLTHGQTLLAKILQMIAQGKWYRYFSSEAIATELFDELILLGADINLFSYTPQINAPMYYFAMNQASDIEKITSLLLTGGIQVLKPDTVNNVVITPLRVLIIMAHPDTLQRKGYLDTVEKLQSFLLNLYAAVSLAVKSIQGQTFNIEEYLKNIHDSKQKLLSLFVIDAEKKGIVVAWYDSVVKLLESIKPNK